MVKNHLKRLTAPKSWDILRKESTFITRPKPGRSFDLAMSLNQVMKSLIHKGDTTKEVRFILSNHQVLVNGKRVYNHRLPVGFMDVLSFPEINEHYRITLSPQGRLKAISISADDAKSRIVKVSGKTRHNGMFQIHCNDGTNILSDNNKYKTGDSLVIKNGKVVHHLPLAKGAVIFLTGGSHLSTIGKVEEFNELNISFSSDKGTFSTAKRFVFVIGKTRPEVVVQ